MNKHKKLEMIAKLFYPSCSQDRWFKELEKIISKNSRVLEIGSGSGKGKQNTLYPSAQEIYGIDLEERVLENPYLNHPRQISAYQIGKEFSDIEFDVIYSEMVAEHIDNEEDFISSQLSVLKPNGKIFHSTVSKFYWTSLINKLVPGKLKNWLIKYLGSGRDTEDIFPVYYKLNSEKKIRQLSNKLGCGYKIIRQDQPPGYLRRSFLLMIIYTLIHKPLQFLFPALRPTFIFILERNPR